tara:strand:- start:367 stop:1593 length:1227 start_codon:yes stop_codon:yes gene_type:complete
MPIPNNGLITETNRQYYEGAQGFITVDSATEYVTTFNTNLVFGGINAWDPNDINYALNNFKLYVSPTGLPGTFEEYTSAYNVVNNTIIFSFAPSDGTYIVVQLKILDGGNYGDKDAFGDTVEENYGSYQYISLNDIINNFMVAYVGTGKLIGAVKRTDVIFHAKRGMQEFSYDTLKSVKSQELNIPHNLSVAIPQDYVNYVKMSWIDQYGVKHPIYPVNALTTNPYENPIQDQRGLPIQDNFDANIEGDSLTEERWNANNIFPVVNDNTNLENGWYNGDNWVQDRFFGRLFGIDPQYANMNGYFSINDREGKISFSSNLVGKLIVLEYISDGLAYDLDSRVPKMAEDALYAYILHSIIAHRSGSQEYLVRRLQQDKSAKLRNAKIRLSNIKLEEITQVFRGKSKWIKH